MGSDPERSVVDEHGQSHDVRGLFVGDSSAVPRTLSVNPSLTIMALASQLADHIAAQFPLDTRSGADATTGVGPQKSAAAGSPA